VTKSDGTTLLEVLTTIAIVAVVVAVAVPGAAALGGALTCGGSAERLALVLRSAQARAQSSGDNARVMVQPSGDYDVTVESAEGSVIVARGRLGAAVSSTYPDGGVAFVARGWPVLPGTTSPRAGHFTVGGGVGSRTVVVQLTGCVRCR
jgi:hypothetical protein